MTGKLTLFGLTVGCELVSPNNLTTHDVEICTYTINFTDTTLGIAPITMQQFGFATGVTFTPDYMYRVEDRLTSFQGWTLQRNEGADSYPSRQFWIGLLQWFVRQHFTVYIETTSIHPHIESPYFETVAENLGYKEGPTRIDPDTPLCPETTEIVLKLPINIPQTTCEFSTRSLFGFPNNFHLMSVEELLTDGDILTRKLGQVIKIYKLEELQQELVKEGLLTLSEE